MHWQYYTYLFVATPKLTSRFYGKAVYGIGGNALLFSIFIIHCLHQVFTELNALIPKLLLLLLLKLLLLLRAFAKLIASICFDTSSA